MSDHVVLRRSPIRRRIWTPTHAAHVFNVLGTSPPIVTLNDYFHQLNDLLDIPHSDHNARAEVSWATAEGGRAFSNPLNTTRAEPGAWDYNFAHVKSYPSLALGLKATADTLRQASGLGDFSGILESLRASAGAKHTLEAVENSNWGTGGLALRVLDQVKADYKVYAGRSVAPS